MENKIPLFSEREIAIIVEYNPLHQGHLYQIEEAKKQLDPSNEKRIVLMMSGDFTQRGLPSLFSKEVKAFQAVLSGVDLVLEIPPAFVLAPANLFAKGAVESLAKTKQNFFLVFGAECPSLEKLKGLAALSLFLEFLQESKEQRVFSQKQGQHFAKAHSLFLQFFYKKISNTKDFGFSKLLEQKNIFKKREDFPTHQHPLLIYTEEEIQALLKNLAHYLDNTKFLQKISSEEMQLLLQQSNNILAIEYLKQILLLDFEQKQTFFEGQIQPHLILRKGQAYLASEKNKHTAFASASALRKEMKYFSETDKESMAFLQKQLSLAAFLSLQKHFSSADLDNKLLFADQLLPWIKIKILERLKEKNLQESKQNNIAYLTPTMENTLLNLVKEEKFFTFNEYESFLEELRNKQKSKASWSRALCCLLLHLKEDAWLNEQKKGILHLQVLKHSEKAIPLLKKIKKESVLPLTFGTDTKKHPYAALFKKYRKLFLMQSYPCLKLLETEETKKFLLTEKEKKAFFLSSKLEKTPEKIYNDEKERLREESL